MPQGSIRGPLLLFLYINDFAAVYVCSFADYTNIFSNGRDINKIVKIMQLVLSKLYHWLQVNFSTLN